MLCNVILTPPNTIYDLYYSTVEESMEPAIASPLISMHGPFIVRMSKRCIRGQLALLVGRRPPLESYPFIVAAIIELALQMILSLA